MTKKADLPLQSYYELYRLALQFENKSPATLFSYFQYLTQFQRWLERTVNRTPILADLTVENVQGFVAYLREKRPWDGNPNIPTQEGHLSPFTVTGEVRTIKTFASWLCKEGHTRDHVLKRLALPKVPKLLTMPLTEQEIQRIFSCLNTKTRVGGRDYAMIFLFLDSGIRASELCNLALDDVRLDKEPGWIKVRGKGDKERIVYLGRVAQHAMLTYKTFVRVGTYTNRFFVTTRGQPMTAETVAHAITEVAERSGVERLHAHLLRHTAATQYLVAGGDAISLQQKLGHTTLTMTSRYVHLASQDLAAIRARVSPMDKVRIKPLNRPYRKAKQ